MSSPSSVGHGSGPLRADPGERVSVEGGALEPGSGRCTVDPGAQLDKDEHNRGGVRTLRLTSRVACGQVHRVWITRSSGSRSHLVTACRTGRIWRAPAIGPPLGLCQPFGLKALTGRADTCTEGGPSWVIAGPGLPWVTPASAHRPPRGSPHISQHERPGCRCRCCLGEVGVGVQIRPRAAGDARPAGSLATPYPGAVSPVPTAGARSMVSPCARDLWGGTAERPPWVFPRPRSRPLWCARLPSVGGAPKDQGGDFPAGTIQVPAGRGGGGPAARRGMCAAGPRKPGLAPPRGRLGSRDQQVRHASVRRSMRRGVSVSPPRRLHRHLGSGRCAGGGTPTRLAARQDGTADLKRGAIWSSEWGRGRGRGRPSWSPQRWPATRASRSLAEGWTHGPSGPDTRKRPLTAQ